MLDFSDEGTLLYGLLILLFVIGLTLLALLCQAGLLTSFDIKTCRPVVGKIKIAYKCGRGPYKESGILFTEMHTLLPQYRTLGVYYDDPKKKEQSRLRYIVGLVLSEDDSEVDKNAEKTLVEKGYKFATLPRINHAVQTTFPFNGTLGVIIAIYRVYPALGEYVRERNLCAHPYIEVYDSAKSEIIFYAPLERQDEFYVPEVLEYDRKPEDDDNQSTASYDDSVSFGRDHSLRDSESIQESSCSVSHREEKHLEEAESKKIDQIPVLSAKRELPSPEKLEQPFAPDDKVIEDIRCANSDDDSNLKLGEMDLCTSQVIEKDSTDENRDSDENTVSSFEEIDENEIPPCAEANE